MSRHTQPTRNTLNEYAYEALEGINPSLPKVDRILKLARTLMNHHQLWDWSVRTTDTKRILGLCDYGKCMLSLNATYVMAATDGYIIDTILHEIAHALAGPGTGHGSKWKAIACRIGAIPASGSYIKSENMPDTHYRWALECQHESCSFRARYHRKPAATTILGGRCPSHMSKPLLLKSLTG